MPGHIPHSASSLDHHSNALIKSVLWCRERGREHGRSQREGDRKRRRSRSREQLPGPPSRKRDGDGLSVAETNKLRESLGMKLLKP